MARTRSLPAVAAAGAAASMLALSVFSTPGAAAADTPATVPTGRAALDGDGPVSVGLIGDFLYNADQVDDAERMFADLRGADLDLTLHDGDTTYAPVEKFRCSEDVLRYHLDLMNSLDHPVVYTPGDNEWTDCPEYVETYGAQNLGYTDPFLALKTVREVFFPTSRSLGGETIPMTVQSKDFPENRRITVAGVPVATLHVVGSLNGYEQVGLVPALAQEIPARQEADLAWLKETFAEAKRTDAPGVMIVWHANPDPYTERMWEAETTAERPPLWDDAYEELLAELRTQVAEFGKPVALMHGDSHVFRIDKPLTAEAGTTFSLTNFTRVETFGTPNLHWIEATIDPEDPEVFRFEQRIVPGNTEPPEETSAG